MSIWLVTACPEAHATRLTAMLRSLEWPHGQTVVVTSRRHDRLSPDHVGDRWYLVDQAPSFSLARLWNLGLSVAYDNGATEVAVLSTDVTGHPNSLAVLMVEMRAAGCVMAGPTLVGHQAGVYADTHRTTTRRVPGGCFMLAAEHRLLCDEAFRWWFTDDDLETQAREVGPVGVFDGTGLTMGPDSALTEERARWAAEDRERYVAKWQREPW